MNGSRVKNRHCVCLSGVRLRGNSLKCAANQSRGVSGGNPGCVHCTGGSVA